MFKLLKNLKSVTIHIFLVVVFLAGQVVCSLYVPDQMSGLSSQMRIMAESVPGSDIYNQALNQIWLMGGYMLAFVLGSTICAVIVSYLSSYVSAVFARELRRKIFRKVTSLSLTEFDMFGVSSLITRTTNDVTQIQQAILMCLRIMVQAPLTLIIAIIMVVSKYDPTLILIICVSAPLLGILLTVIFIKAVPLLKSMQKKIDKTTLVLRENITGVRVIRAFDRQLDESKKFNKANKDLTYVNIKANRYFALLMPSIMFIMNITYIGVIFIGFFSNQGATMVEFTTKFSEIMAVAQYVLQIMMAFMMFAMIFMFVPRASVSSQRINAILDLPTPVETFKMDNETKEALSKTKGLLEFKDVTFQFADSDEPTLQNISFKCEPNKTTAIIGSTGSGKSTIINLIPRFYEVTKGQVLLDGVDIKKIPGDVIRDKLSFVPQKALLFQGTIKENMLFGNPNATDEEINEALKVSQSLSFVEAKEDGVNSYVSQGGTNFSGGQKQRLCIARALVKKGEIYVFDDSFSALDFKTDVKVRQALKEYTKGSTVIIVGQRVSSIMDSDNIIVLDEGKIVGQGTHSELLKTNKVYQEIVKSQLDPDEVESTRKLTSSIKEEN